MKKCYTISSLKALLELPLLDVAQFTLNGRQFPSSRKTVAALQMIREAGIRANIVIHYDFIYIISRYALFTPSVREAILEEVVGLLTFAEADKRIMGIVMHTDWPIRKEVTIATDKESVARKFYTSSVWDINSVVTAVEDLDILVATSVKLFAKDLNEHYKGASKCKVLLENTTKVGPNGEGSFEWLVSLLNSDSILKDTFGLVYDTEHHYAVTGEWKEASELVELSKEYDILVHLNTVPNEVKPGSRTDRHSFTTVFECSLHNVDYYKEFTNTLDQANLVWIREVKEQTMFKEWNQLSQSQMQQIK